MVNGIKFTWYQSFSSVTAGYLKYFCAHFSSYRSLGKISVAGVDHFVNFRLGRRLALVLALLIYGTIARELLTAAIADLY